MKEHWKALTTAKLGGLSKNNPLLKGQSEVETIQQESLKNFENHKEQVQSVELWQRYERYQPAKAERIKHCGDFLTLDLYADTQEMTLEWHLRHANFCKNRFCPMCAWRKARKFAGEMKSVFEQFQEQEQGRVSFLLLTLTIKNPILSELRASIKKMSEAFQRLAQLDEFQKVILGYIRAIEFLGDNTPDGQAHPHFHVILAVDRVKYFQARNFISQKRWISLWKKALRADYEPNVDIRRIRAKDEQWTDVDSALFETLKYCISPQNLKGLSQRDFLRLDRETKGVRQYNTGGFLKSIKPNQNYNADCLKLVLIEYYEWVRDHYNLTQSVSVKNNML